MDMSMELDTSALFKKLDSLNEFAQTKVIRAGTQAATQEVYDMAKVLVPVSTKGHWFHGTSFKINKKKYWFDSGTLKESIYQVYSKDNSGAGVATYHVAWNHKKCPYGHMVEYGTAKHAPHSFLRRGYEYTKNQSILEANRKMASMLEQFV